MKEKMITPKAYLNIKMGCSHRAFYDVKQRIWDCAESIDEDQEIRQGYTQESSDHDGDLDTIRIFSCERSLEYIGLVKKEFNIKKKTLLGVDLVFTVV
jgi:hypothetical protein